MIISRLRIKQIHRDSVFNISMYVLQRDFLFSFTHPDRNINKSLLMYIWNYNGNHVLLCAYYLIQFHSKYWWIFQTNTVSFWLFIVTSITHKHLTWFIFLLVQKYVFPACNDIMCIISLYVSIAKRIMSCKQYMKINCRYQTVEILKYSICTDYTINPILLFEPKPN